ncbi:hypothetical protein J6590_053971 [Homalodisca vitripennis]|nr:hypothetical protein J6590_053971 [Homalodisca vitripennis]
MRVIGYSGDHHDFQGQPQFQDKTPTATQRPVRFPEETGSNIMTSHESERRHQPTLSHEELKKAKRIDLSMTKQNGRQKWIAAEQSVTNKKKHATHNCTVHKQRGRAIKTSSREKRSELIKRKPRNCRNIKEQIKFNSCIIAGPRTWPRQSTQAIIRQTTKSPIVGARAKWGSAEVRVELLVLLDVVTTLPGPSGLKNQEATDAHCNNPRQRSEPSQLQCGSEDNKITEICLQRNHDVSTYLLWCVRQMFFMYVLYSGFSFMIFLNLLLD